MVVNSSPRLILYKPCFATKQKKNVRVRRGYRVKSEKRVLALPCPSPGFSSRNNCNQTRGKQQFAVARGFSLAKEKPGRKNRHIGFQNTSLSPRYYPLHPQRAGPTGHQNSEATQHYAMCSNGCATTRRFMHRSCCRNAAWEKPGWMLGFAKEISTAPSKRLADVFAWDMRAMDRGVGLC